MKSELVKKTLKLYGGEELWPANQYIETDFIDCKIAGFEKHENYSHFHDRLFKVICELINIRGC